MTASIARPANVVPMPEKIAASRKATTADNFLFGALAEADEQLDACERTMFGRVNAEAPAANHLVLSDIRRIARNLMIACDEYEVWP